MGTIFLIGVIVIVVLVMLDEFFEAYEEWRKDIDEDGF